MTNVNELLVFIASPGDLAAERAALRDLEQRVNSRFRSAGMRVRVSGWEELSSDFGRPQGQINPLVDECDVFIGLLRRRWGTPTGEAESGFIEEFDRAIARRKASGSDPHIAMYFAEIPKAELDDAGPGLRKVLQFKKQFERNRVGMHASFASPSDLVAKVFDMLHEILLHEIMERVSQATPAGSSAVEPSRQEDVDEEAKMHVPDEAQMQMIEVVERIKSALYGSSNTIHAQDRDRLQLFASAIGADRGLLGTHLVNRLYRRIDDLELVRGERLSWIRTLLSDVAANSNSTERVIPGWALVESVWDDPLVGLLELASEEGEVGRGAILEARRANSYPPEMWDASDSSTTQWVAIFNANPASDEAVLYLLQGARALGLSIPRLLTVLEAVKGSLASPSERSSFLAEVVDALRGNLEALASRLVYSTDVAEIWRTMNFGVDQLDPRQIDQLAVGVKDLPLRRAVVVRGLQDNLLADSTLLSLLSERSRGLSALVLDRARQDTELARRLFRLVKDAPASEAPPADLRATLFALVVSEDELTYSARENVWHSEAWEALTHLRPSDLLPEAISILTDDADLKIRLSQALPADLVQFVLSERKRAAAALLARDFSSDSSQNAALVLRWFDGVASAGFISDEAWQVMLQLAESSHQAVPKGFFSKYLEVLGFASATNLLDSALGESLAPALALSERSWEREPAAVWLIKRQERSLEELKGALLDDFAAVRAAACMRLTLQMESDELEVLLKSYVSGDGFRWYNVIALLDEHLYSPFRPRASLPTGGE